eukprot:2031573-Prymnesium_polylepis.1
MAVVTVAAARERSMKKRRSTRRARTLRWKARRVCCAPLSVACARVRAIKCRLSVGMGRGGGRVVPAESTM